MFNPPKEYIPNEVLAVFNGLCRLGHDFLGNFLLGRPGIGSKGKGRLLLGLMVGMVVVVVAVVIVYMSKPTTSNC